MFAVVSCGAEDNKNEPKGRVEYNVSDTLQKQNKKETVIVSKETQQGATKTGHKAGPTISIEYHTPESLKKYEDDVAAYHAAQKQMQTGTIDNKNNNGR